MLTSRIKYAFNKSAMRYDQHNDLQLRVGETLFNLLPNKNREFSHILDAGCGTGSVTRIFAKQCFYQAFSGIDIAKDLLQKAEKNTAPFSIDLTLADFNHPLPKAAYDLIFSNMALHWSHDLIKTFKNLQSVLAHDGMFIFSIPLEGTLEELRPYCAVHHFNSSNKITSMLLKAGLTVSSFSTEKMVLPFSDWKSALYSLKNIGANYAAQNFKGLSINPNLKKLIQKTMLDDIALTYQLGYFIIEK